MDSCTLCFTHLNKKAKGKEPFFQPLSLAKETRKGYKDKGFARSMQTRSIRLVSFHSTYRFLVLRIQTRDTKIMASREVCEPFIPLAARDNG